MAARISFQVRDYFLFSAYTFLLLYSPGVIPVCRLKKLQKKLAFFILSASAISSWNTAYRYSLAALVTALNIWLLVSEIIS